MSELAQSLATSPESLDPAGEAEWLRLRQQIEFAEGFWLGFIFTPSPHAAAVLRRRTERILKSKARLLHPILPQEPAQLREVVAAIASPAAVAAGCVWVEALRADSDGAAPWTDAWDDVFLRVNERRDFIRRRLGGGLVFVALPSLKPRVRDAAPDLWSVRSIVLDLPAAPIPPAPLNGGADEESGSTVLVSTPTAHDRQFALDEAQRQTERAERIPDPGSRALAHARIAVQTAMALLRDGRHREALERARDATHALERLPGLKPLELAAAYALWSEAEESDGDLAAATEHIERAVALTAGSDERLRLEWIERAFRLAQRIGDASASLRFAEQMVDFARRRATAHADAEGLRDLSVSLEKVGDVRRAAGELSAATAVYEESLGIRRRILTAFGETAEALRGLSVSLNKVGNVRRATGELAAAAAAYEESLGLCRRALRAFGETPEALRDLSVSLNKVGDVRRAAGDLPGASAAYEESLGLCRRILTAFGETAEALRDLSVGLDRAGDERRATGALPGATATYEESLGIRRRILAAFGETPRALRDVSVSLEKVGDARRATGDLPGASAAHEESLGLRRRILAAFGETPEALRDLSVSLNKVGDVRRATGDLPGASAAYEESLGLRRRILTAFGETPRALRDLSLSLNRVGDVRRVADDQRVASAAYEESLGLRRRILTTFGETPEALRDLSVSLDNVGDVRRTAGDLPAATAAYEESLNIDRRIVVRYGESLQALQDLSVSLRKVSEVREDAGDTAGAAALDEERAAVEQRLASLQAGPTTS